MAARTPFAHCGVDSAASGGACGQRRAGAGGHVAALTLPGSRGAAASVRCLLGELSELKMETDGTCCRL